MFSVVNINLVVNSTFLRQAPIFLNRDIACKSSEGCWYFLRYNYGLADERTNSISNLLISLGMNSEKITKVVGGQDIKRKVTIVIHAG